MHKVGWEFTSDGGRKGKGKKGGGTVDKRNTSGRVGV